MTNVTMLVHNRPRLTKQALESLGVSDAFNLTILADEADVVTSHSLGWFTRFRPNTRVVYNHKSQGTGIARNIVVERSRIFFSVGDYLYLSDNDVFFYTGWLEVLIQCYELAWQHGYRVLGGYNHPYHQPVSLLPLHNGFQVKEVHALALQSMLMRWEVWDKYGPFCSTPVGKVCQSEDVDFTNKIKADGGRIGVVDPPLLVNTGITNSFGEKIPGWEMVKAQAPKGVIVE
jgi:GT2 family glycosyltransferase